jgi:phospholipid/cholesterol/gamma-HCH transport system substrate-binding protein
MGNMEIATEKFAENMEAMRTNWLFRGYFSERGYWDNLEQDIELIEEREAQLRELEDRLNTQAAELERRERGDGSGSR